MVLIDRENAKNLVEVHEDSHKSKEYASKGVAGTALGLGIAGTAGWVLNMLGGGNGPLNLGWGNNYGANRCCNEQYLERKECDDVVKLTNAIWKQSFDAQAARAHDRSVLNNELFGIYAGMRNGFDGINAKHNEDAFALYKYSRDSKDELLAQIGDMKAELAVLKATRPYQDKLIQCAIDNVAQVADFNLWRRTCRMITGQVVLPNTPTVTGFGSFNTCNCGQQVTAAAGE